jgi:TonB-like protein
MTGDYYPNWLRTIVGAIFDPGAPLQGFDLARSSDNPMIGGTKVCRRFTSIAGVPPVSNKVFSTFCFDEGLLDFVGKPGYDATYKNYKNFAGKHVARTISEEIESGTVVEATIEELTELKSPDDSKFAVQETNVPLQTLKADESTLRSLGVNTPDIVWPATHRGADKGTLSLYVCLDRNGQVREIYQLNSSNPGLSEVARDQVMKWQFKRASSHGAPVQVESVLTFAFHATNASTK